VSFLRIAIKPARDNSFCSDVAFFLSKEAEALNFCASKIKS
jgi:hypothetical protein